MKIAVSGAHHTGKTTLIGELIDVFPAFRAIDEPYYQLEEEGYAFAEMPSLEDFEVQLERSIQSIRESAGDSVFDRCPCDILAYMVTHDDSDRVDLDSWVPAVLGAMQLIDLAIFTPVEDPDRMPLVDPNDLLLRSRVDSELRSMILDDQWSLGIPTIEVTGFPRARAGQVKRHLEGI